MTRSRLLRLGRGALLVLCLLAMSHGLFAGTNGAMPAGDTAWLRYSPIRSAAARRRYERQLPATVVALSGAATKSALPIQSAQQEIERGVRGMLGRVLRQQSQLPADGAIVLGTTTAVHRALPSLALPTGLRLDGYWLKTATVRGHRVIVVASPEPRGVLYGAFALLRRVATHQSVAELDLVSNPAAPVRWVNEWDNLNGTIERGYGGRSIFFENGHVVSDLSRAAAYARLLASVGINGCTVNNVNSDPRILTPEFLDELARIADAFRPWGVRLSIAVDFSSPEKIGGLNTFDPLNPQVANWWKQKADEVYGKIPDLGGFLVKADSEGRLGPSAYGRTQADAANVLARALKPHDGLVMYRAFVYHHPLDFNNLKADRARAAWDIFSPLDGKFDDNVIVQIKNGPIDFQVREPASPLFGALRHTSQAIELEITQEYMGQQRHLCYLAPMWKTTLDFDMHAGPGGASTPVKQLVTGRSFHRPLGGFVGVSDVGRDRTWLGSDLALANLYSFGRLAWNPDLSPAHIIDEWTRMSFGNDATVDRIIEAMQLRSWHVFEEYSGPLGLQSLTNIVGPHYGPAPEAADNNGWGQWIRAGHDGVGMDRTIATGTGYIGQYAKPVARRYESLKTCPDTLLLFMHHVPYTYRLHAGKTVIQTIYDLHYAGAAAAQQYPRDWETLQGTIDPLRYQAVLERLRYQAGHAIVWRDAIDNWFYRESGIPDQLGRVGHDPHRIEAEAMGLQGYQAVTVHPFEAASGSRAISCPASAGICTATFHFSGQPGCYDVSVQYFDQNSGNAEFRLLLNGTPLDAWTANDQLPSRRLDADTSTRHTVKGVALRPGDVLEIQGTPQGGDSAAVDYVTLHPSPS